jgi:stearoyl-CoA desaturase (delta-9 desaturase)
VTSQGRVAAAESQQMAIASFFLLHWWGSVFFQTLYHHRYASHRMFTMGKRTERVLHFLSYVFQGSSYLDVRAYAILHREHHAFSDTDRDPHSPMNHTNAFTMMVATNERYQGYAQRKVDPEARFLGGIPEWPLLDRLGRSWTARFVWMGLYTAFYLAFATAWWQFLLLPVHFVMGPVHGAIVNWCGHKNGYRNYASKDQSRNTLPFDFVTLGELFQNNHHHGSRNPNFARRWFEIDPTYLVMRVMAKVGLIRFVVQPKGAVEDGDAEPAEAPALRQAS